MDIKEEQFVNKESENSILNNENGYFTYTADDGMEYVENLLLEVEQKFTWTHDATKLFLSLYKEKIDLFNSKKIRHKKILWQRIADEMKQHNYDISRFQVENKFKSLERAYRKSRVNNRPGKPKMFCPFERDLTGILGNKYNDQKPIVLSGTQLVDILGIKRNTAPLSATSPFNGTVNTLKTCQKSLQCLIEEMRRNRSYQIKLETRTLGEYKKSCEANRNGMKKIEEQLEISNQLRKETNDILKKLIEQSSN